MDAIPEADRKHVGRRIRWRCPQLPSTHQQHVEHRSGRDQQGAEGDHDRPSHRDGKHPSLQIPGDPDVTAHRVDQRQASETDEANAGRDRIRSPPAPSRSSRTPRPTRRQRPSEPRPEKFARSRGDRARCCLGSRPGLQPSDGGIAHLVLSILSYAGKVTVGVRVDEAVSKHPARLVDYSKRIFRHAAESKPFVLSARHVTCDSRRAPSSGKGFRE